MSEDCDLARDDAHEVTASTMSEVDRRIGPSFRLLAFRVESLPTDAQRKEAARKVFEHANELRLRYGIPAPNDGVPISTQNAQNQIGDDALDTYDESKQAKTDREALVPIEIGLTQTCNLETLVLFRERIGSELAELESFLNSNDKIQEDYRITEPETVVALNVILGKMLGLSSLSNLRSAVKMYNKPSTQELPAYLRGEAEVLAYEERIASVKSMSAVFSQLSEVHDNKAIPENFMFLRQMVSWLSLRTAYNDLMMDVNGGNPGLLKLLGDYRDVNDRLHETEWSSDYVSLAIDFIADKLQLGKKALIQTFDLAASLEVLVKFWGEGILVLIDRQTYMGIAKIDPQKWGKICLVIQHRLPMIHPICIMLKFHIYDPIERGAKSLLKSFENLEVKDGQTFMDVILEAVRALDLGNGKETGEKNAEEDRKEDGHEKGHETGPKDGQPVQDSN